MSRRSGVVLLVMACVVAACGGEPPTSPGGDATKVAEPVTASAQADGVLVTVVLSAGRVAAGETVDVEVRVRNAGMGAVSWQSGGCELLNGFSSEAPTFDQPPAGREWPGAMGLAKWSATTGGVSIEPVRPAGLPAGMNFGCPSDLRVGEIQPGGTETAEAEWPVLRSDGVPGPAGVYRIGYSFPLIGRVPADQVRDPFGTRPIVLEVPVTVTGTPFAGIASTQAIDAAFADARVAAWATARLTQQTLAGAEIRLVDGRWRFTIRLMDDRATVVLVDAETGGVVDVELAG